MEHGVNINPVAFLVVQSNNVKLLPVCHSSALDKLLDYMPDAIEKANSLINKQMQNKKNEKAKTENSSNRETKTEKNNTGTSRIRPKRNRVRNNEMYEYEYNEVPQEDTFDIEEDIEETDDE